MLRTWLLEFLQNIPLTGAFLFGFAQAAAGRTVSAVIIVLAGSLAGTLLIRWTEPIITGGPIERPEESLGNFILFSTAMFLAIPYFRWGDGGWLSDVLIGALIGALTAWFQAWNARAPVSPKHSAALVIAFAAAFLVLRFWLLVLPALSASIVLAAVMTTIIVAVEYWRR